MRLWIMDVSCDNNRYHADYDDEGGSGINHPFTMALSISYPNVSPF